MPRHPFRRFYVACTVAIAVVVEGSAAPPTRDDVIPVRLLVDNPTIHHLAFRWLVEGDENRNAAVDVRFRKTHEASWRAALPMLRILREKTAQGAIDGNLFAGSVLNLEPGSEYEVRFELSDPDGGHATATRTVTTRVQPARNLPGRRQVHVYPERFEGPRLSPAFADLATAFAQSEPGDLVLIHAGTYRGPYRVAAGGTAGRPIVFRAAGDGEVIVDGGGDDTVGVIEVEPGRDHLWFENLSVRGGRCGIRGMRTDGLVVRGCRIWDVLYGVTTGTEPRNFANTNWYVADNVLIGRYEQWKKYVKTHFGAGINLAGRGHVACFNRISFFWDGISTAHVKTVDPSWVTDPDGAQQAIDIYGNDISQTVDDGIEADAIMCNARVMSNRVRESLVGISVQPCHAGPLFVVRNLLYRFSQAPWKLFVAPTGVVLYHNTSVAGLWQSLSTGETNLTNSTSRNNLFVGGRDGVGITSDDSRTTLDYDGIDGPVVANRKRFASLAAFVAASGQERHGVVVDLSGFVAPPTFDMDREYPHDDVDLRLTTASPAVDAGLPLPTVNDGFDGRAPDLGALERGRDSPRYGPREEALR